MPLRRTRAIYGVACLQRDGIGNYRYRFEEYFHDGEVLSLFGNTIRVYKRLSSTFLLLGAALKALAES